jgi:hypothetical protein
MNSHRRYGGFLPPGQASHRQHSRDDLQFALRWLKDVLAKGPLFQKDIDNQSEAAGIPHSLLYRAKKELRVISTNVNNKKTHADWKLWFWELRATRTFSAQQAAAR